MFQKILKFGLCLPMCLSSAFAFAQNGAPQKTDKVIVSIPPVAAIVGTLLKDVAEPRLLMPRNISPHNYTLLPGEVKILQKAELIIYAHENLESFIHKIKEIYPEKTYLSLTDRLPSSEKIHYKDKWLLDADDHHAHDHEREGHDDELRMVDEETDALIRKLRESVMGEHEDHDHDENGLDPHFWLNPQNVSALVPIIEEQLYEIYPKAVYPDRRTYIKTNALALLEELKELDERLEKKLAPFKNEAFMALHDGFGYFSERYDLNYVGSFSVGPTETVRAFDFDDLRQVAQRAKLKCIVNDSLSNELNAELLSTSLHLNSVTLDVIGRDLYLYDNLYINMMDRLADGFVECLGEFVTRKSTIEE